VLEPLTIEIQKNCQLVHYVLMLLGFDGLGLGHIPSKWPWMKSLYQVYWVAQIQMMFAENVWEFLRHMS
jgi:hypothetical protein